MFSLDILVPISIAFVSHHEHIFLHFHVFSGMDDNRFGHVACARIMPGFTVMRGSKNSFPFFIIRV
jgi:hypothetical protein